VGPKICWSLSSTSSADDRSHHSSAHTDGRINLAASILHGLVGRPIGSPALPTHPTFFVIDGKPGGLGLLHQRKGSLVVGRV
jgi:hypothetical protein